MVPLIGHAALRARLAAAAGRGSLPASVLLHGPRGIGKQRLALWLAQTLLCTDPATSDETGELVACGVCRSCRYAAGLTHPDLQWVFPRPRPKDQDIGAAEVAREYADAIAERVRDGMLYGPPDGTEAIYVSTVRALAHDAALTPAMSARKVLVIGDADRLVAQEGADAAANALLKLLEEPPADTTIILTSSEPGALLPTVRSRVAAIRVAPLDASDIAEWLRHPHVRATLDAAGPAASDADRATRARGAPGTLLGEARTAAAARATALIDAAQSARASARYRVALQQGAAGARGAFSQCPRRAHRPDERRELAQPSSRWMTERRMRHASLSQRWPRRRRAPTATSIRSSWRRVYCGPFASRFPVAGDDVRWCAPRPSARDRTPGKPRRPPAPALASGP